MSKYNLALNHPFLFTIGVQKPPLYRKCANNPICLKPSHASHPLFTCISHHQYAENETPIYIYYHPPLCSHN